MSRSAFGWLLAILSILLLGYLTSTHLAQWRALLDLSAGTAVGIGTLYLSARGCGALGMRRGLARLGIRVGVFEALGLALVASYTNLLLPRTGVASIAIYLKRRHALMISSYLSLSIVLLLLSAVVCGLLGVGTQIGLARWSGQPMRSDLLMVFLAAAGIASCALMLPPAAFDALPSSISTRVRGVHEAWQGMARQWRVLGQIMLLHGSAALLRALRLQLVLSAVGADVPLPVVLLGSLLADLATLVSVTPAALGFREAALAYAASLLRVEPSVAVLAALLDRLVWTAVVIVLGQIAVWRSFGGLGALRREEREIEAGTQ